MPDYYLTYKQRIHYQEYNPQADRLIVLLHGLGVNSASWQLQAEALSKAGFHVIIPDLPGFGLSSKSGSASIKHVAALNAALLDSIVGRRTSIAGISMGGVIALQMALDYPNLVEKLVLISAFDKLRPAKLSEWIFFIKRALIVITSGVTEQAQFVARRLFPEEDQAPLRKIFVEQVAQAEPSAYRSTMLALVSFNASHRLRNILAPTLIITGAADTVVSPEIQKRLFQGIPAARQVIIPSAGHAVIADNPDMVNKVLIEFLSNEDDSIHA